MRAALAQTAIRQSFLALFVRVPRLLEQLAIPRASADYSSTPERIAKIDVLILDDFLLAPMRYVAIAMIESFIAGLLTGLMIALLLLMMTMENKAAPAKCSTPWYGRQYL